MLGLLLCLLLLIVLWPLIKAYALLILLVAVVFIIVDGTKNRRL